MVRRFLCPRRVLLAALAPAASRAARAPAGEREARSRAADRAPCARAATRASSSASSPGASADAGDQRRCAASSGGASRSARGRSPRFPTARSTPWRALPGVSGVSLDRRVQGTLERTGATIGATWVHDTLGFDGTGVGIAIIDSGVANWHDDLGSGRVARFVDFVNFQPSAYDDYGHGTHVAGIIAGNGYDSGGRRRGIAPGATLLVEKVLDASGAGLHQQRHRGDRLRHRQQGRAAPPRHQSLGRGRRLRVVHHRSAHPRGQARRRRGPRRRLRRRQSRHAARTAQPQYGAIGAPGNAPWVITVGASSHNGTADRSDDTVAAFSSRGPSAHRLPGQAGSASRPASASSRSAEPGSTLFNTKPLMRLWGTVATANEPYLSLSGTSMASPVVSGTIALMLQANPALTPNLVKAILQYTAESRDGYDALTQGGGFLNARGAVELAQALARGDSMALSRLRRSGALERPRRLGQPPLGGGAPRRTATAWRTDVLWGSAKTPRRRQRDVGSGLRRLRLRRQRERRQRRREHRLGHGHRRREHRVGHRYRAPRTSCGERRAANADCENIVWGTSLVANGRQSVVWGTSSDDGENIVWGTNVPGGRRRGLACASPAMAGPMSIRRKAVWGASMKNLPLAARIYVCAIIAVGAALLLAFFPVQFVGNTLLFLRCCCCRRSPRSSR